ncbi:MAG TPA: hypothetical protein PKO15_19075 [Fibrobacteria bacterium]|nr:hypothetical protein [Fibrobacteria bacterium]HOX52621.1 hypothetical protein [Fibrobacteria bacterium]
MTVSELPALLGLRRNFTFRLACDASMFARRFGLNVSTDERSWLGKRLELFKSDREPYLGEIESSSFHLECRPSPLGSFLGRIAVQGGIRQVGGLTILEGVVDGYRTWKSWMASIAVVAILLCVGLAISVGDGPNKALVLMAILPGLVAYLAISAGILYFLLVREAERLTGVLESNLKEWVR